MPSADLLAERLSRVAQQIRDRASFADVPTTRKHLMISWAEVIEAAQAAQLGTQEEIARLRNAVLNQCGDNLCRFDLGSAAAEAKALPEPEFLESCRRYRAKIASEHGEFAGGKTIAELEAECERLRYLQREFVKTLETLEELSEVPVATLAGGIEVVALETYFHLQRSLRQLIDVYSGKVQP